MVDLDVAVIDGSYHDVDSSEMSFKIAGSMALQDAVKNAAPVILEPIMKVEVTTPEANMGDIIGDLSSRRAQIGGTAQRGNARVHCHGATSELSLSTAIRSLTGRPYYMEPSHYQDLPNSLAAKLLKSSTN
jgi:elongation factor G